MRSILVLKHAQYKLRPENINSRIRRNQNESP
nr:MAG TPA: hypothetical protein [Caudoviricetes sp.]